MKHTVAAALVALFCCASAAADDGRLYGSVVTRDGEVITGAIRWDGEEVFWTDHFNGRKWKPMDLSELDADQREAIFDHQPGPQIDIGGRTVEFVKWFSEEELRPQDFAIEFGAIAEIVPGGGERVDLHLRDGVVVEADGGSNDIEADVEVRGDDGSEREVDWRDIERVRLHAPSAQPRRFEPHLFGTVVSEDGTFTGAVQWDQDERFWSERLDWEADGDERDMEFGQIAEIHRLENASRVVTRDGRSLEVTGTNDVNDSNRGIYVDLPGVGRIDIPWKRFKSLSLTDEDPKALTPLSEFESLAPLAGDVEDRDGAVHSGTLVYDLDEASGGEQISGRTAAGIGYLIPLRLVRSVEPAENGSRVTLRNGTVLDLVGDRDINHNNQGVLVRNGEESTYLAWDRIRAIRFR